jgi:hypothetical protein
VRGIETFYLNRRRIPGRWRWRLARTRRQNSPYTS